VGTYNLPRNVKGEGRILFIFTGKSLIYSAIAGGVGLIFYFIFSQLDLAMVGIGITVTFALIGFLIGTFKVPDISKFEFTKKTGGENIDDIIRRAIKFKTKGKKIYIYEEGKKNAWCNEHINFNINNSDGCNSCSTSYSGNSIFCFKR